MVKLIGCFLLCVVATRGVAIEISYAQLAMLQNEGEASLQMSALNHEVTDIWHQHLRLHRLAKSEVVSVNEQTWVSSLLSTEAILSVPNPDHPNQQLVVVDIAKQASAVKILWEMKSMAEDIERQWQYGSLDWKNVVLHQDKSRAMRWWLTTISTARAEQVAEHAIQQGIEYVSVNNAMLSALIQQSRSPVLMQYLWANTPDAFTYQVLQQVPNQLNEADAIEQLIVASRNQPLASQAIMLLAKHYSHNQKAQMFLQSALNDPQLQWLTAAAVGMLKDSQP
ncbi:hypothetical protein DRW07_14115 [Alteromonas sediminis]|uniref:Uncharacterized protein n=1 Tax=Alteromonas sediminis TaxID=2259342 RepID=A0A3N5Y6A4_9ALTE|nr:hypothetical protein [Alteromonas sediminis]RPJ65939.1 hypothetical protein DRW07_14115 [Alteromonas sediminis]